ncbi:MAG: hypothetical protein RLZZ338_3774 [Cyanobacteriota bacterium]|jgi:putative component of toxin-antitoxin plasmid stabilization module
MGNSLCRDRKVPLQEWLDSLRILKKQAKIVFRLQCIKLVTLVDYRAVEVF